MSKSRSTTVAMVLLDGEYQNLQTSSLCFFVLGLTVSEILAFQIVYPESLSQSHVVQHLKWQISE